MSAERAQLLMLRGVIAEMPPEDQAKVSECADKVRAVMAEHGQHGLLGVVLVAAEEAAK